MGRIVLNVSDLFSYAFGNNSVNKLNTEIEIFEPDATKYANVIFEEEEKNPLLTPKRYGFGLPFSSHGLYFAPPLMYSFSRDKNIIRTTIEQSENEVIEYFGFQPFQIRIQGILTDQENHQHPAELIRKLNQMYNAKKTYKAIGGIFNDLNINSIFFEGGLEVSFIEGFVDTVKFSLNAVQVAPVEVRLIKPV